jgi:hypothetical protein
MYVYICITTRCPQAELLDDCVARLLGHFEKGLWERVTAVTRCAKPWMVRMRRATMSNILQNAPVEPPRSGSPLSWHPPRQQQLLSTSWLTFINMITRCIGVLIRASADTELHESKPVVQSPITSCYSVRNLKRIHHACLTM